MAKQPEFTRYLPLDEWLRQQPAALSHIQLTSDQAEAILVAPLPASASKTGDLVDYCPTVDPASPPRLV